MKLNRRRFLVSTSGACVGAAALAAPAVMQLGATRTEGQVLRILADRFPHLDVQHGIVRRFAAELLARPADQVGPSLTTRAEALDPRYRSADFERYVCREFVTCTNYLEAGQPGFKGLALRGSVT